MFHSLSKQNAAAQAVLEAPRRARVTPLLHRLPVCFWVQFRMLINTFKALHGIGPGSLGNHLTPMGLAHPTCTNKGGILPIWLVKEFWLAGSSRRVFSAGIPALWNILTSEARLASSLLTFHKSLKIWLCQMAWTPNEGAS